MRRVLLLIFGTAVVTALCFYIKPQTDTVRAGLVRSVKPLPDLSETAPVTEVNKNPEGVILNERVRCTPLTVIQYSRYEGPYMEDGSDREVGNVASVLLYNGSSQTVAYCRVYLETEGETQVFAASMLPPDSTTIVLEEEGKPYRMTLPNVLRGMVRNTEAESSLLNRVRIESLDLGTLRVTNISGAPLPSMRFCHKTCIDGEAVYVGGIAYRTEMAGLMPGESVLLQPDHYAEGYSKIVWALPSGGQ